jgi:hypothetical protein
MVRALHGAPMTYRAGIEARAREAAEAARDEVLHAELRGLENLLACCRDEPSPDKQQIEEIRRTIKWVRRQLRLPPSGEERRPSRPAEPQPEPEPEPAPDQHICWHEARRQWGWRCRGDHISDLLIIFGACRADGERWFWSAKAHEETVIERHGFEPSADQLHHPLPRLHLRRMTAMPLEQKERDESTLKRKYDADGQDLPAVGFPYAGRLEENRAPRR